MMNIFIQSLLHKGGGEKTRAKWDPLDPNVIDKVTRTN
jgi:hypothetical protein